jgi:hypothetical protein
MYVLEYLIYHLRPYGIDKHYETDLNHPPIFLDKINCDPKTGSNCTSTTQLYTNN